MEIAESLYEKLNEIENIEELKNFLRVVKIKGRAINKIDPYKYVSKEKYRSIRGVFYDSETKQAIFSDGYILVASAKHYNEKFAGKIVGKNGEIINEYFPNWKQLRPSIKKEIDILQIPEDFLQERKKNKNTRYYIGFDGIIFDFDLYKKALDAANFLGLNKLSYNPENKKLQVYFYNEEIYDFIILMPVLQTDNDSIVLKIR